MTVSTPPLQHANMLSIATKTWSLAVEGSEGQYRQMVVKEWVEQVSLSLSLSRARALSLSLSLSRALSDRFHEL